MFKPFSNNLYNFHVQEHFGSPSDEEFKIVQLTKVKEKFRNMEASSYRLVSSYILKHSSKFMVTAEQNDAGFLCWQRMFVQDWTDSISYVLV